MAWVRIEQSMPRHRKTIKLARQLHISRRECVGLMVDLWLWAMDNADQDGVLRGMTEDDIAGALDWQGEEDLAHELLMVGFLDPGKGGLRIHDWDMYGGNYAAVKDSSRERTRRYRERHRDGDVTEVVTVCDGDVTRHSDGTVTEDVTVNDRHCHGQDKIREDKSIPTTPLPPAGGAVVDVRIACLRNQWLLAFGSEPTGMAGQAIVDALDDAGEAAAEYAIRETAKKKPRNCTRYFNAVITNLVNAGVKDNESFTRWQKNGSTAAQIAAPEAYDDEQDFLKAVHS